MATLERLAHQADVADAFEAVVRAATGQLHQVGNEIARDLARVHEMRYSEFFGDRFAFRIDVDAHDPVGTYQTRALNDVETDAAEPENHHVRARLHLGGVDHRADAGRHAATDVADLVERRVFTNFC